MSNRILVQIYEVQSPEEAEKMIRLGVDHVGTVLLDEDRCTDPVIRRTVETVRRLGAKSSVIPLFHRETAVDRTLDALRPDIVHFCDLLDETDAGRALQDRFCRLQRRIRERFPQVKVMRSIPIPPENGGGVGPVLAAARRFETVSDFFLTDTLLPPIDGESDAAQPVAGFVGITGVTCSWRHARALVEQSGIPVVLAGGISPENVEDGIAAVRPAGVDSCTCTNAVDEKGKPIRFQKDPARVRMLVEAVRRAGRRSNAPG